MQIEVRVEGTAALSRAFGAFVGDLLDAIRPGFVPLRRFRGAAGAPFAYEQVDLIGRRHGFEVRGEGWLP